MLMGVCRAADQAGLLARDEQGGDGFEQSLMGGMRFEGGAELRLVEQSLDTFKRIDILVNNAGITKDNLLMRMGDDEWDAVIAVNLKGVFNCTKAVVRPMMKARSGRIVNIASTAGLVGYRYFAAYVAAKHGVVGLTKAAALDLAPHGVRVNALCPGSVRDDPATEGIMLSAIADALGLPADDYESEFSKAQPTNALVEHGAVATAAAFLISDGSSGMTGSIVTVDGGFSSQ